MAAKLPKVGERYAKLRTNRNGVQNVISRRVVAVAPRRPHGTTILYSRRYGSSRNYCQCTLTDWRRWVGKRDPVPDLH